ncbi:hypothetical protein SLS62_008162 [Diatrype stigma]|uniref:Uncharacterized protein n=1 Tax=Diatrype stigma TaxID=117547 RepID=A0AAN9YL78_9PEZI
MVSDSKQSKVVFIIFEQDRVESAPSPKEQLERCRLRDGGSTCWLSEMSPNDVVPAMRQYDEEEKRRALGQADALLLAMNRSSITSKQ